MKSHGLEAPLRKLRLSRCLAIVLTASLFAGCAPDAAVRERTPRFRPLSGVSEQKLQIEATLMHALRLVHEKPLVALEENMKAARTSLKELKANPGDSDAMSCYNFAVARILGIIRDAKLDPWSRPLVVPSGVDSFVLTSKPDTRALWNPALYTFTPADQFTIGGKFVDEHATRSGLGAPVVAVGRGVNPKWREDYTTKRLYYGLTAVARFHGNTCVISFEDPLDTETTSVEGHTFALAADFTVPMAVMLANTAPQMPKLERMLFPEKYAETAYLSRLEPYNPEKTVVLVIHGLMDSPSTWAPMIIHLRSDPEIRRHYQFWFYSYPSGYPYPYTASLLRTELDGAERKFPLRRRMVVIGHSMGGCISRLLITDTGEKLWTLMFNKAPAQTRLPPKTRKLLTDTLVFQHRPEIGRVIFICAPLQGSEVATISIGRIGSMLIQTPSMLLAAGKDILEVTPFQSDDLKIRRAPNSIDTLSPRSRFVRMINRIPIAHGIPYHTIIGDRGKGDSPHSSDGVVPYWSSHVKGAQSECIVPCDHAAQRNPAALAEVLRILKLNAENPE